MILKLGAAGEPCANFSCKLGAAGEPCVNFSWLWCSLCATKEWAAAEPGVIENRDIVVVVSK